MERIAIKPRPDWQAAAEELGFDWHTAEAPGGGSQVYWDESAYWQLSAAEVDDIEAAVTRVREELKGAKSLLQTEQDRELRESEVVNLHPTLDFSHEELSKYGWLGITDNALIPMKERVADRKYDPIVWLGNKLFRR